MPPAAGSLMTYSWSLGNPRSTLCLLSYLPFTFCMFIAVYILVLILFLPPLLLTVSLFSERHSPSSSRTTSAPHIQPLPEWTSLGLCHYFLRHRYFLVTDLQTLKVISGSSYPLCSLKNHLSTKVKTQLESPPPSALLPIPPMTLHLATRPPLTSNIDGHYVPTVLPPSTTHHSNAPYTLTTN